MNGKEKLKHFATQFALLVESNPCNLSDETMENIATTFSTLVRLKVKQEISREEAARYLNISTRTLSRLVKQGAVQPHRDYHQRIMFYLDDIEQYRVAQSTNQ